VFAQPLHGPGFAAAQHPAQSENVGDHPGVHGVLLIDGPTR
jgi:hypothetical protein